MALPKRDKKFKVKLFTCLYCGASGRHYSYQCAQNPANICKYCQSNTHNSLNCHKNPQKPIKKESSSTRSKRLTTSREWFKLNLPDDNGMWLCYLRISPHCPGFLTRSTIRLEHVKSKVRYKHLRYDLNNIKASCEHCNRAKGSLDLEELPTLRVRKDSQL